MKKIDFENKILQNYIKMFITLLFNYLFLNVSSFRNKLMDMISKPITIFHLFKSQFATPSMFGHRDQYLDRANRLLKICDWC